MHPIGGQANLLEDLQPGANARLDGVDERAVEIEDQRPRIGQVGEADQRRRVNTYAPRPSSTTAASPNASRMSLPPAVGVPPPADVGAGVREIVGVADGARALAVATGVEAMVGVGVGV